MIWTDRILNVCIILLNISLKNHFVCLQILLDLLWTSDLRKSGRTLWFASGIHLWTTVAARSSTTLLRRRTTRSWRSAGAVSPPHWEDVATWCPNSSRKRSTSSGWWQRTSMALVHTASPNHSSPRILSVWYYLLIYMYNLYLS